MAIPDIRDVPVAGKRVLVRVDFNVPMQAGKIRDDTRIRAALPTIKDLVDRGAAVILMSHLGRPKSGPDPEFSLARVAERLQQLLGQDVQLAADVVGQAAQAAAKALQPGHVLMLENVRFEPGEEKNNPALARDLASLAGIYVNDAFGAAHRAHASTAGIADYLPSYAGQLMMTEIEALGRLLDGPGRPFVAILGGAKVSDKIAVISHLIERVDALLLGGGMANTFLLATGVEIGQSLAEEDFVAEARQILIRARATGVEIGLPVDVVVSVSLDEPALTTRVDDVDPSEAIYDIGPGTVAGYSEIIAKSKTLFWNGPMGVFERPAFAAGTLGVARAVAESNAYSVVGGGDSVAAIVQSGLAGEISHISTGGGASLEFIEGKELPGIAALAGERKLR